MMNNIDLIHGRAIYCPTCGHHLAPRGEVNGNSAHVEAYCPLCDNDYHWVAYVNKNKKHSIGMFRQFFNVNRIEENKNEKI